jgi:hypothetical protein
LGEPLFITENRLADHTTIVVVTTAFHGDGHLDVGSFRRISTAQISRSPVFQGRTERLPWDRGIVLEHTPMGINSSGKESIEPEDGSGFDRQQFGAS